MPALTTQTLATAENEMQVLAENEYTAINRRLWWPLLGKVLPALSRMATVSWLLTTVRLKVTHGASFDDLATQHTEITPDPINTSLRLTREQWEDSRDSGSTISGSEGIDLALQWSEQAAGAIAYWPQEQAAKILRLGHLTEANGGFNAYTGKAFFAKDHPLDPYNAAAGTFANLLEGAADGDYPGACPIDVSVTLEVARENLGKVYAHIGGIKLPDAQGFRCLRPKALLVPPKLYPRAQALCASMSIAAITPAPDATFAELVTQAAALGNVVPAMAGELSGFESETSYFVICEQVESSQLAAMVMLEREAFAIAYYGDKTGAEAARLRELEWHVFGRAKVATGHPHQLMKVKAS